MHLSAISLALTRIYGSPFIPSSLFAAGEQGVWYDPSDFDRYMSSLGPELVTNGTFDEGITGWSTVGGSTTKAVSWTGNSIELSVSTTGTCVASGAMTALVSAKTYVVTGDCVLYDAGLATVFFGDGTQTVGTISAAGPFRFVVTPNAAYARVNFGRISAGTNALQRIQIDNISVRELTAIDTATLFQDSAGTTPVTAVEQPVGLMLDKSKGLTLGPELSAYASGFSSTTGITGIGATVALSGASLVTTATSTDGADRAEIPISGLTTGQRYLVTLVARRGAQGTNQSIRTSTALNIPNSLLASTSNQTFTFRVDAIAASGVIRVYAADATGAVGDSIIVDSISVREIAGNHATQTATSRPVLSARVNLLTSSEDFSISPWTNPTGGVTRAKNTLTFTGQNQTVSQPVTTPAPVGASARFSVEVSGSGSIYIGVARSGAATYEQTVLKVDLTSTPTRYEIAHTIVNAGQTGFVGFIGTATDGTSRVVTVDKADLRYVNIGTNLPAYQRVNTSTDYDTAGFPLYLLTDGVDDWYQTNSINFTGTDKMTVFAGVRKLSDAAAGIVAELSADLNSNPGTFYLAGPLSSGGLRSYGFVTKGTFLAVALSGVGAFPAPITNVLTGIGNISGDSTILRVNGTQVASISADQGTGNYGNYPLFLFRRGGTTLPAQLRFYGLIVRGAASTPQQIAQAEAWMNQRTRAY